MTTAYATKEDIANRAIQHLGARRISSLSSDTTSVGVEINACFDQIRQAELRRSVWTFATRRCVMRVLTAGAYVIVPSTYAAGTTYIAGDIVQDTDGVFWQSQSAGNTGNTPGTYVAGRPQWWLRYYGHNYVNLWDSGSVPYQAGELVYKSGPIFYVSQSNANSADPATSGWGTISGSPTGVTPLLYFPAGPSMIDLDDNTTSRNLYPLPYGFLRLAAQDKKIAGGAVHATSGAVQYTDWIVENGYIIRNSTDPFLMRYVADVDEVSQMEPMFCEALAARIAYELCEKITQSNIKLQAIAAAYQKFMQEARMLARIESGSTEPEEEIFQLTQGPQGVSETPQASQQGR